MPTLPGPSIQTGSDSEGSLAAENQVSLWTGNSGKELANQGQAISIGALPDDVLLPIFDSYLHEVRRNSIPEESTRAWQSLTHVCRQWRSVVFGSPRRLDLRLCCTNTTRSRDMLDIWPALPLIIKDIGHPTDIIVAALKCSDRVCQIDVVIFEILDWELYLAEMQQPFLELTNLDLRWSREIEMVVVPDSFLGGFAPRLKGLDLSGIPFPGLPKLLLSATHLVQLRLHHIPHSGYFSPDVMVAALSTLTSIEDLSLRFKSPESCPDLEIRRLPLLTRSVLPALKSFEFKGVSEYLEDLVIDIDAPQLNKLVIMFFNDIVFDTPQLIRFISRTPISSALENAHIALSVSDICVTFRTIFGHVKLEVLIFCEALDWQLPSLEQVCTSCSPFLSTLGDLHIYEDASLRRNWKDNIEYRGWLGLLHPFSAMKNLYISDRIALLIGPALQELVESRATEVLPALDNIFLEKFKSLGRVQKGIGQFVAARQVSSHPVAVSLWEKDQNHKKWHVCQMCSKTFVTSSHLSRHTRIHTGELGYKCPFPGCYTQCFSQNSLQQHYRTHSTLGSRQHVVRS